MNRKNIKKTIRTYSILTFALLVMVFEIFFFKYPNNFTIGGVSGLSVVLGKLVLSPAVWNAILNISLLILAFFTLGKETGVKTVYSCIFLSVMLYVLERVVPADFHLNTDPWLDLLVAITAHGVALGIIFSIGATSGGTDILAMIVKKKFKTNVGEALTVVDLCITLTTFFVFGWKTGLYSLVGQFMQGFAVDYAIRKINLCKSVTVITDNCDEVLQYIHKTLNRGATIYDATGSYLGQHKKVLLTVLSQRQVAKLDSYLQENYPSAFIIVTEVDHIIGYRFKYI